MNVPRREDITIRDILAMEPEDFSLEFLRDIFAVYYGETAPKFETTHKITVPPGRLHNDKAIETTLGRYIFNLLALPEKYLKKYGFYNNQLNKKNLEKLENTLGLMVLNDEITTQEMGKYLDYGEWLGMGCAYFLNPTMNYDINLPIKEVIDRRDELFEKYKDEIRRGESSAAEIIEKELIQLAREKIKEKNNPAYDFFESGVSKFENNYKKTSIMCGAIENPYTKKLDILKSNYTDGVDPREFPKFSNLTLTGGHSRGVATKTSGYQAKKIRNACQGIVLDDAGSDCNTKYTLDIIIPEELKSLFTYRYVLDTNGKLVMLDENNIDNYVNKKIKMRSPMFCKGENICNKCAGELFYKMGVKNARIVE